MNKKELVKEVMYQASLTNVEIEAFVEAFKETIIESLAQREEIRILGFGTFTTQKRNARKGINPATKKEINIPETTVAKFKPAKVLRDLVNK